MASRKERLKNTNPFAMPGENAPSLTDLTNSMIDDAPDEDAIELIGNGRMVYKGVELTQIGLVFHEDLNEETWRELGAVLKTYDDAIQWMLGDWANAGFANAQAWGKFNPDADDNDSKYAALLANTGYSYGTLSNFAAVAAKIPIPRRRGNLSYSHHVEVAYLDDPEKQDDFLDLAEPTDDRGRLSVRDLRERIRPKKQKRSSFLDRQIKQVDSVRKKAKKMKPSQRQQLAQLYAKLADELRNM